MLPEYHNCHGGTSNFPVSRQDFLFQFKSGRQDDEIDKKKVEEEKEDACGLEKQ
jgi:hypothetical protein